MSPGQMDQLRALRRAGSAASVLMKMNTRRLGGRFTVPLESVNLPVGVKDPVAYGLTGSRVSDRDDDLDAVIYAAMEPYLAQAIEAARTALVRIVVEVGMSMDRLMRNRRWWWLHPVVLIGWIVQAISYSIILFGWHY
jgi:hypothetical protein